MRYTTVMTVAGHHALRGLLVASVLTLVAACGESRKSATRESEKPAAAAGQPIKVNLDEIFPPGPGRDLVLNNCQSCHTWVPIVILRMDKAAWYRNSLEHRERVKGLRNEEFKILYNYLSSTFTLDRPIPELPPELLGTWTSY
jgi:cytochrome c5